MKIVITNVCQRTKKIGKSGWSLSKQIFWDSSTDTLLRFGGVNKNSYNIFKRDIINRISYKWGVPLINLKASTTYVLGSSLLQFSQARKTRHLLPSPLPFVAGQ